MVAPREVYVRRKMRVYVRFVGAVVSIAVDEGAMESPVGLQGGQRLKGEYRACPSPFFFKQK